MDLIRKEALEEILKRPGRVYTHEAKAMAQELLDWRAGKDPTRFDGVVIQVPRTLIVGGYYNSTYIHKMAVGETKLIRLEPTFGKYSYFVMHRMPEPEK